jgi:type I restriction enzyme R subunit
LTTDVIISGNHNDLPHLKVYSDQSRHESSIKSFKLAFGIEEEGVTGNMGILIVNNMLITGFDAPVEQVMYLDKVIVAHNLLQAIARVNRVGGESKDKGFVVDYVGVGHHLKKAIDAYDEREQKEVLDSLSFPEEELRELGASHAAVMDLLKKHGLTDLTDHDAFFDLFYDEDLRFDYLLAFKQLTKCLNLVFPARQALDYMADYQALTEINVLAGKHLRDERLSMKGIPPKLRGITDAYLESKGIEMKIEPISIGTGFTRNWRSYGPVSSKPAKSQLMDYTARSRCRCSGCLPGRYSREIKQPRLLTLLCSQTRRCLMLRTKRTGSANWLTLRRKPFCPWSGS